MKEHGYYTLVRDYLFPPGRTKNDLLNAINDTHYDTNFAMLLCYINLLGPSYHKLGNYHWIKTIREPYTIWLDECREKYNGYTHRI